VISGGVNIYPAEIEQRCVRCPGVEDCAVFGVPDAEFGESLAAAVQPRAGRADGRPVRTSCASNCGLQGAGTVTFHEALPREDTGKIFKRKLREPYGPEVRRV